MSKLLEYASGTLTETEQAEQVPAWQQHRLLLLEKLGATGTQVRRYAVREGDQDAPPHEFLRAAENEFIYPPQEVGEEQDNSRDLDTTPGYTIRRENITWAYAPAQVRGHLKVTYDDSDNGIWLSVVDLVDTGSDLPPDIQSAVGELAAVAAATLGHS